MSDPLVVIDRSAIRHERIDELRRSFADLAAFVRENEPRPIAYQVYLDEPGGTVTVLQIHPDASSLADHMDVAGPEFARFAELLQMAAVDVLGTPGDEILERLRAKATMLGGGPPRVHERIAGFERFTGSPAR